MVDRSAAVQPGTLNTSTHAQYLKCKRLLSGLIFILNLHFISEAIGSMFVSGRNPH